MQNNKEGTRKTGRSLRAFLPSMTRSLPRAVLYPPLVHQLGRIEDGVKLILMLREIGAVA